MQRLLSKTTAILLALAAAPAAQADSSVVGPVTANVVGGATLAVAKASAATGLTIGPASSQGTSIYFGALTAGTSAGTATVGQGGVITTTGGVKSLTSMGSYALYVVKRSSVSDPQVVNVTGTKTFTLASAGGQMQCTLNYPSTLSVTAGHDSMSQFLYVYGTLNVNANQPSGDYSGLYTINVNY